MNILAIQYNHMKTRCYFISAMCSMSLYSWYNYSLFDPVIINFFTPYYQNCLLMLFYLGWDTYKMTLSEHKTILFRTDLIIHHIISLIIYLSYINNTTLQISHVLIMECISLMNYIWKDNPQILNIYRTCCILLVRMPLSFWFWLYYNPNIMYPFWKLTREYNHYVYLKTLVNIYLFFIFYDVYILWKIYQPKHKNIKKQIDN